MWYVWSTFIYEELQYINQTIVFIKNYIHNYRYQPLTLTIDMVQLQNIYNN